MKLRAAVIGVGRMGSNHARMATDIPGVELIAIADTSEALTRDVARRHHVAGYRTAEELLVKERPDLVVVAVPTEQHLAAAGAALRAGAHVLVEKPIAGTLADGRKLIAIAARSSGRLFVGHIERFNPAVQELARRLRRGEAGRLVRIHARRLSPFPARVQDAGVLIDLGTHDLDIMRLLLASEAETVWAVSRRHAHPRHEDLVVATILFPKDVIGTLELNWLTPTKIRELSVLGERGLFTVNYLSQELVFFENALVRGKWDVLGNLMAGVGEGRIVRYPIVHVEPLRAEWEAFVGSVKGRKTASVSGADALLTLELAEAIRRSAKTGRPVKVAHR